MSDETQQSGDEQARQRQQEQQKQAYEDAKGDEEQPEGEQDFPEADFKTFVSGLYTQTLMALGQMENPSTGEREQSLPESSYLIDTLEVLRDKTEGNLTQDESQYLNNIIHDLQMRYVQAAEGNENE